MGTFALIAIFVAVVVALLYGVTSVARAAPPVRRRGGCCGGCSCGPADNSGGLMTGIAAGGMLHSATSHDAPVDRDHDGIPDNVDPDHGTGSDNSPADSGGCDSGGCDSGGCDSGGGSDSGSSGGSSD